MNQEFSEQELKKIKLSEKQFEEGKFYTQEEVEEMFGLEVNEEW